MKTVIAVPEGHHVEVHAPGVMPGMPMISPQGAPPGAAGPAGAVGAAPPGAPGVIPTPALDGAKAAMDQALAAGDAGKAGKTKAVPKLEKKKKKKHPTGDASALAQGSADAAEETPDSDEG